MIAIFTVLGFVLFGGGAYAIYDGWPYMVLERGFTQVIIGSIASSAGLILLSLAWVLREFGALKRSLAEGVSVRSEPPVVPAATEAARAPWEAARAERAAKLPPIVPAAVGAVAGAAAAGAVADALVVTPGEAPAPESVPRPERDLFGALVAQRLEEPQPQQHDEPDAPVPQVEEPLPDMFAQEFAERAGEHEEAPIAVETESHEPAEIVAAKVQPVAEDEALAHAAEPIIHPGAAPEYADRPASGEDRGKPVGTNTDADEFTALRESLAGHLNEPVSSDTRIEPSLAPEPDPFAEAEAWMDKASPRREPWFEEPAALEKAEDDAVSPPWPPRTEAHEFAAASETSGAEATDEPEVAAAAAEKDVVPEDAGEADVAEEVTPAEEAIEHGQAVSPERAASEEGVVGAYQVGDAHFTIFADGSIRARTPDGEYSFASMDELKVYLASEKSRLGM